MGLVGVAFDLGSTLIWFDGQWEAVLEEMLDELSAACRAMGWELDWEALRVRMRGELLQRGAGRGMDPIERPTGDLLRRVLRELGLARYAPDQFRAALRAFYRPSEARWKPVPEAGAVIETLRRAGYRLGMISNAGDGENVRRLLRNCALDGHFEPLLISAEFGLRKPASAIFQGLLQQWRAEPQQVVMVGDRLVEDVLGAQRVGMRQIWVRRYAEPDQPMQNQVQPEFSLQDLAQVPQCVAQMEGEVR